MLVQVMIEDYRKVFGRLILRLNKYYILSRKPQNSAKGLTNIIFRPKAYNSFWCQNGRSMNYYDDG